MKGNKKLGKDYPASIIFAAVIILSCFAIFIFEYNDVYDNSDIIPPSLVVKLHYLVAAIVFACVAATVAIITRNRIKIYILLPIAILLPILCWNLNYHTLKKDGIFYPLVSNEGVLHSITIGDYNFDGMNDEKYRKMYEEREVTSAYGADYDPVINMVETKAVGTGTGLDWCFPSMSKSVKGFSLNISKTDLSLKQIEITVSLKESSKAENISFCWLKGTESVPIEHTVNEDGDICLVLNAELCARMQAQLEKDTGKIVFTYSSN